MFYLVSFQTKGIDSWEKIRGKTIFNGPPRGGALTAARGLIKFATGMSEGKGYTGKQVVWGSSNALFLDGGVDAAVRPGNNPPTWIPQYIAAGKLNIVSFPKAKFNSKGFQKFVHGPGNVPVVLPISGLKFGGAKVISEDNMFRTLSQTAGDVVNKSMSKTLAKKLTAAFIKNLGELRKKTPWAPGALYGSTDNAEMGYCKVGVKFHPGAVEAWEEAGIVCKVDYDLGTILETRAPKQMSKEAPKALYQFYEVTVTSEETEWPEKHKRNRQWANFAEASEALKARPELLEALKRSTIAR